MCNLLALVGPLEPGEQALRRLVSGDIPQFELVSSIEAIFSSEKAIDMVSHLQRSDAQTFINAVDEVWRHAPVPEKPCFPPLLTSCT